MNPIAEGLYTIPIKNVREILSKGSKNEQMWNAKSYNDIVRWKDVPFMTDVIQWQIRLYPLGEELKLYLQVINENAPKIDKYIYVNLQQNHRDKGQWYPGNSTNVGRELAFKKDHFATKVGIDMVPLMKLDRDTLRKVTTHDTIVIKMAIWFVLDSIWIPSWNVCNKKPDILFVLEEVTFSAHRAMLAGRSSVFKSKLAGLERDQPKNSNYMLLTMGGNIDKLTLKYLLHFIYTDSLHPDFKKDTRRYKYERLFYAAHCYQIEKLRKLSEDLMAKAERRHFLDGMGYCYPLIKFDPKK